MYVCVCSAVTEQQIRQAAEDGVTSLRELSRDYGVATGCGQCARQARAILDEALQARETQTTSLDNIRNTSERAFA